MMTGPAAQRGNLLVEGLVRGHLSPETKQHLHEAVVALGQHAGELAARSRRA